MDMVIKAAAIALIGAVLGLTLKKQEPQTALLIALCVSVIILSFAARVLRDITDFISMLGQTAGISSEVLDIVFKCVGISVISKLSADMCRDAGQSGAASGIEFTASVSALLISLPLYKAVVEMIGDLV